MSGQGTFVYHPLGPQAALFRFWSESIAGGGRGAPVAAAVAARYRRHLAAQFRGRPAATVPPLPAVLEEDGRPLVADFHSFFPAFLARIGVPAAVAETPISFPGLNIFDARVVTADGERAIFVSSRALDTVELFARTMSLGAALNMRALPTLIRNEDPPPAAVVLAWLPFIGLGAPGFRLDDLRGAAEARLRERVFGALQASGAELRQAFGYWRLTHYLAELMLLAMERLLRGDGREGAPFLEVPAPPASNAPGSIDARYLATLVLTFVVLHELAHLTHRHDSLEPMVEDPQIRRIVDAAMRSAQEHGHEAVDLTASTQRLEQDADCFPFDVTPPEFRDALLETATLWLTALACADRGGIGWLERSAQAKGRAYPQYAMRVWFLNGRYSTGARQGDVARTSTQAAEAIAAHPSLADEPAAEWLPIFRALWALAHHEVSTA